MFYLLQVLFIVYHWGKARERLQAGAWNRDRLLACPWRAQLPFFYSPVYLFEDGAAHSGLGPLTSIKNWENAAQPCTAMPTVQSLVRQVPSLLVCLADSNDEPPHAASVVWRCFLHRFSPQPPKPHPCFIPPVDLRHGQSHWANHLTLPKTLWVFLWKIFPCKYIFIKLSTPTVNWKSISFLTKGSDRQY